MNFEEHFNTLEDGRTDINISHNLLDVVFLTLVAIISGAEGWKDIQLFGDAKLEWLGKYRDFESGIPRRHTIARIIGGLSPDNLLDCFLSWVNSVRESKGQQHYAIDGKTLRGSRCGDKHSALHLLSVMAVESGLVVYQQRSQGKKNEIRTVLDMLELFDVKGSCVTLDAMHCQTESVQKLRDNQADFVIQIKNNQKKLLDEIQAYFHKIRRDDPELIDAGYFSDFDKGHGRIEERHYTRLDVSDWIEQAEKWCDLNSIIEVQRIVHEKDTTRKETAYYISSLNQNTQEIADKIRRHWHIENSQHWVLDMTYREDDSRVRTGDSPENLALFRRFAFNIAKLSSLKDSMKGILKRAAWDDNARTQLLFG